MQDNCVCFFFHVNFLLKEITWQNCKRPVLCKLKSTVTDVKNISVRIPCKTATILFGFQCTFDLCVCTLTFSFPWQLIWKSFLNLCHLRFSSLFRFVRFVYYNHRRRTRNYSYASCGIMSHMGLVVFILSFLTFNFNDM